MGLFNNLLSAIWSHAPKAAAPTSAPAAGAAPKAAAPASAPAAGATTAAPAPAGTTAPAPAAQVDVGAILDGLAAKSSEQLDWKRSIVDLMKLVGMDSSLGARKELAKDLGYSGDMSDSASMNVWLHSAVMKKIAENGGKVPADLLKA
jgi:3-oxoacyl-ACP reductase-like protein